MKRITVLAAAGLLVLAGTAAATTAVRTFPAKPTTIHPSGSPQCASLRYILSVRAEDVELSIVNAARREVCDVDRERTGVAAGRLFAFRWCGQTKHGHKIGPGHYRWRVEAHQATNDVNVRSGWRTIRVSR